MLTALTGGWDVEVAMIYKVKDYKYKDILKIWRDMDGSKDWIDEENIKTSEVVVH